MDRWRRVLAQSMRVGAIGFAGLLLLIDLATGGTVQVATGACIALLALHTCDLRRRIVGALALSLIGDVVAPPFSDGAFTFGLAEAAGLGLLLVLATRQLTPRAARWAVPALAVAVLLLPQRLGGDQTGLTFVLAVCVAMAIALGGLLRAQDSERRAAVERVRSDERLSLARDLHDSVAHHITGIVVRAQAAQVVSRRRPDEAVAALAAIEHEGSATLASLRRLVGVLRDPDSERQPPPGLAQVQDMVSRFSAGGPPTTLSASPEAAGADIPDEVGAALHRVVQEALTNVRRHALRPHAVSVDIDVVDDALVARVRDDGRDGHTTRGGDAGFGLVGLEERVRALGGTLTAGPIAGGGWEVAAALPLGRDAAATPPAALPGRGWVATGTVAGSTPTGTVAGSTPTGSAAGSTPAAPTPGSAPDGDPRSGGP